MGTKRKIEIRQRFGRLEVLEDLGIHQIKSKKYRMLRCRCDCGNICEVPGPLLGKMTNSCGCLRSELKAQPIVPGTRFGRLSVIEKDGTVKNRGWKYKCQCDCGNIVTVRGDRLRSGETTSCGCLHDDLFNAHKPDNYKRMYVDGTSLPKIAGNITQRNNISGYRGVSWHKKSHKWQARIGFKGHTYYLGYYSTPEDASKAYQAAKNRIHGEFLDWYASEHPEEWAKFNKKHRADS